MVCYANLSYPMLLCGKLRKTMLLYAMRCCAVSFYVVLGYVVMLCHTVLLETRGGCYAMLRKGWRCYAMPCFAVLCFVVPCYALLCCAMLCSAMVYSSMLYCATLN